MTQRKITHRYRDPLELIWLRAAEQLGMRVERSPDVYASWDGKDTLTLAGSADFDADDSLAPGSMPGGPEYAEEASEGGEDDPRGTPAD